MNICRAADAIAFFRKNRTHDRLAPLALDHWTLRDIGVTPFGISEAALAESNEAGARAGGRS